MDLLYSILIILVLVSLGESVTKNFTVTEFGAVGDGETDDSMAFLKAWRAVCEAEEDDTSTSTPTLLIPENYTFLLQPVEFRGPCKSKNFVIQISGNITAPSSYKDWKSTTDCWLPFNKMDGLIIQGSGTIDGQGSSWWEKHRNKRPRAMCFHYCNNFLIREISLTNSPTLHITMTSCMNGTISNINITAPENSPNTDGIDIAYSSKIQIKDSFIGTGDDCVAINGGCSNINITGIQCRPGHGISIGSLGDGKNDTVEHVYVRSCNFSGTQNAARIKTFKNGIGYAKNIAFEEIKINNSKNPIIIDQFYKSPIPNHMDHENDDGDYGEEDYISVSNVTFKHIEGTSASKEAITLDCNVKGCFNIVLEDVNITASRSKDTVVAVCNNVVNGSAISTVPCVPCLSKEKNCLYSETHI